MTNEEKEIVPSHEFILGSSDRISLSYMQLSVYEY